MATLVELKPGTRPKGLVWTTERTAHWHAAYTTAVQQPQKQARGQRVTGFQNWRGLPRPSRVMVWTPQQTGTFLDHAAEYPLYAAFHLLAFRGLRRGEACGLHWTDVDLEGGTATVRTQRRQLGWQVEETPTKTESSQAPVALDADTVAVRAPTGPGRTRTGRPGARRGKARATSSPRRTAHRCIPRS